MAAQADNGARINPGAGTGPSASGKTTGGKTTAAKGRVRLRTLVVIRWVAIIGQLAAILFLRYGLDYPLPILAALLVVGASALLNVAVQIRYPTSKRLTDGRAALYLTYDSVQLAALLYLTGGLNNPFSILFMVPVTVSATILSLRSTVCIGVVVLALVSVLAVVHMPLPWAEPGLELPRLYVFGLWAAVVMGVIFISVYVSRVAAEARRLSDALTETQFSLTREQKVSALGGLAAATAHELGTPLSTIATVAKEIVLEAPPDTVLAEDAALISREVRRCREILGGLAQRPETEPRAHDPRDLATLVREAAAPHWRDGVKVEFHMPEGGGQPALRHSLELVRGLGNFVQNAVDFAQSKVIIRAEVGAFEIQVQVSDDGPGFPSEILKALGEPYVSARANGEGLGLGVFISMTLLERTGAAVQFANQPQGGAMVRVTWPRQALDAATGAA